MSVQLVWFKRDLRTTDHRPLYEAAKAGPCLGLYLYEPSVFEADDFDASHLEFINQSLRELQERIDTLGGKLCIRKGEAADILDDFHQQVGIETLWSHEETGNAITYQRDLKVQAWCAANSVTWKEIPQTGVIRRLGNRDGWSAAWQRRMKEPLTPEPEPFTSVMTSVQQVETGSTHTAEQLGLNASERTSAQEGGAAKAQAVLQSFLQQRGENYRSDMSSPSLGETGCSRISPYLAWGNISIREVFQSTRQRVAEVKEQKASGQQVGNWLKSLSSFQSRLSWHCHFMQKLEDEPDIEFYNMNRGYDGLRENDFDSNKFDAWCHGQTGYPMVDACMRALKATGWINFRMRAMLVSFASYHLWLHWRPTALYASRLFLDYEPGIHYSQFQMQSGVTGINTVRIYSPIKQVADNDPKGEFIRRWVPELEQVPDELLAEPHKMTSMEQIFYGCQIGKDYPPPIVEHKTAYKQARDRIFAVKKDARTRELSQKVYEKHGSRKTPMRERR